MNPMSIVEMSVHTNKKPLGAVRSIHIERSDLFDEAGQWVEGPPRREESFSFDLEDRLVEFISYNRDSSVCRRSVYAYRTAREAQEENAFDADDRLLYRKIYAYDSEGNRSTLMVYDADGCLKERASYSYDSQGRALETNFYYYDGSLKSQEKYELNDEGVVTRKRVDYNPDGSVKGSLIRIDDPNRRIFHRRFSDADGSLNSEWISSYDLERRETERKHYDSKGSFERKDIWHSDPSGELIRMMTYSAQEEIEEDRLLVYEYDEIGNWTKRTHLVSVLESEPPAYRPGPFIHRMITYWPEQPS